MKLLGYNLFQPEQRIVPASPLRKWMDDSVDRAAYRCLPMTVANSFGWVILNEVPFSAVWNGRSDTDCVRIQALQPRARPQAISHFGNGILTFHLTTLFVTEKGWDTFVTGPINSPKDGIQALTGIVETDWVPFTFTMNWKFTRPNYPVIFDKDEPFCTIFPVRRGELAEVEPETRDIDSESGLKEANKAWSDSRREFNADLRKPGSDAIKKKWQKQYQHAAIETKVKMRPFEDKR